MTSTPARPKDRTQQRFEEYDAFVTYVLNECGKSTKARADLRSGLGRPLERCPAMHRYLVPRLREPERPGWYDDARRAHYTVASLIAARSRRTRDADEEAAAEAAAGQLRAADVDWWTRPNLGASLADAVNRQAMKPDSAEGELHLLVRQSAQSVSMRLPSLTRQILDKGVRIDWSVLLYDLSRWDRDRDRTATRLLESYFRVRTLEDRDAGKKEND